MEKQKRNLAVKTIHGTLWAMGSMTHAVKNGLSLLVPFKNPKKTKIEGNPDPALEKYVFQGAILIKNNQAIKEKKLLENEKILQLTIDAISDGGWDWNIVTGKVKYSDHWIKSLGYSREEVPDDIDFWKSIVHSDDVPKVEKVLNTHLNGRSPFYECENRLRIKSGKYRFSLGRGRVIERDANGKPLRMVGADTDVTERRRAEQSKEKLLHAIDERYKELNGLYSILKLSTEDIPLEDVLKMACDLIPPFWRYPEMTCARIVLEDMEFKTKNFKKTKWIQSRDIKEHDKFCGTIEVYYLGKMLEFEGSPFLKEENALIDGLAMLFGNIIERARVEENIRKLSTVVEQSPTTILITDINGAIEYVNQKFIDVTGYSFEEVKGKNPSILKSGHTEPEEYKQLWETVSSGRTWRGEFHNKRKNGELFWELAHISPIFDKKGVVTHYLAIKEDITELKKLEDQYLRAQKMESIGRLAGGIAHDFNNYLSVIFGYTEILSKELENDEEKKHTLELIQSACEKSEHLTRQLLTFSRREIIKSVVLSLDKSVMNMQKMMERLIPENIDFSVHLAPSEWRIKIDPGQLEQVVMNLIINACDAMSRGGTLKVETKNLNFKEEHITSLVRMPAGRYATLSIKDTGCGISPDNLQKAFEPFFTTKEKFKGTGLGLSTCYGIIKGAGGFIDISSKEGKGTTFYVYLPAVDQIEEKEKKDDFSPRLPEDLKGNEIILLVEDMADLRNLTAQILSGQGYKIIEAANGEEAIDQVRENKTKKIDLLLTDIVMPKMDGGELAKKIKALKPDTKIIYTSGYTDDEAFYRDIQEDGVSFLKKPVARKVLLQTVREVLDRKISQK